MSMKSEERTVPQEGMVLLVPATDGTGYLLCVIARVLKPKNLGGGMLCYFFGPRHLEIPSAEAIKAIKPNEAISIVQTGVRRVLERAWPVIGMVVPFNRLAWPIPKFSRVSKLVPGEAWLVEFRNDRLDDRHEQKISIEEASKYWRDRICGVDIASLEATRILQTQEASIT
jgi:Immunity protein 26